MHHSRHFTLGLFLLLIGLVTLGMTLGWIPPFPGALLSQGWPPVLILIGLWLVVRGWPRSSLDGHMGMLLGMTLIAVGIAKWGTHNHLWPEKAFWPFIFIGLGVGFLLRSVRS